MKPRFSVHGFPAGEGRGTARLRRGELSPPALLPNTGLSLWHPVLAAAVLWGGSRERLQSCQIFSSATLHRLRRSAE